MLGLGFGLTSPASIGGVGVPAAPPWVPTDLGSTLKFWAAADDHGTARMTDDGAGLISSWTDKVGGMIHTATTTARPTWAATSFNSAYNGLTFDGTANTMTSTTLSTLPTGATASTIFMVVSNTGGAGTAALRSAMVYGGGTAGIARWLSRVLGTSSSRLAASDGSTSLADTVGVFDGPHIVSTSFSGTTESARFDGQPTTPATATIATLATTAVRSRIGATNAPSAVQFWSGPMSDILVTTALTTLQHQQLEGYFAWNKGLVALLPVGHPYKSARP